MSMLDARGCLTGEALGSLARVPVGQAPPEVAAHLAACPRCQDRLLRADRSPDETGRRSNGKPYRNLAVVGLALLSTLLLLGIALVVLTGR